MDEFSTWRTEKRDSGALWELGDPGNGAYRLRRETIDRPVSSSPHTRSAYTVHADSHMTGEILRSMRLAHHDTRRFPADPLKKHSYRNQLARLIQLRWWCWKTCCDVTSVSRVQRGALERSNANGSYFSRQMGNKSHVTDKKTSVTLEQSMTLAVQLYVHRRS